MDCYVAFPGLYTVPSLSVPWYPISGRGVEASHRLVQRANDPEAGVRVRPGECIEWEFWQESRMSMLRSPVVNVVVVVLPS